MTTTVRLAHPIDDDTALDLGLTDLPYQLGRVVELTELAAYGLIDAGWAALTDDSDTGNPDPYVTGAEILSLLESLLGADRTFVPAGGTTGQALTKATEADYDLVWATPTPTGPVTPPPPDLSVFEAVFAEEF